MNGALVPDASGELDGEVRSRSDGAAFAASGDLGAEPLLRNDVPWFSAFGGAFLMRRSVHGLVPSAGASQQMSGGPGIAATGGASPQRNGGPVVSCPDGFGRCPQRMVLVGWGGLLVGAVAGVAVGLNGTDVGGDDSGGPVAAVLGASYTEDG